MKAIDLNLREGMSMNQLNGYKNQAGKKMKASEATGWHSSCGHVFIACIHIMSL